MESAWVWRLSPRFPVSARVRLLPRRRCTPAPPVLEFDSDGNLLRSWGGPGPNYDWPKNEHGIFVDHDGNVWLADGGGQLGVITPADPPVVSRLVVTSPPPAGPAARPPNGLAAPKNASNRSPIEPKPSKFGA